jgi:ATP-binding cassette subfamily B protein
MIKPFLAAIGSTLRHRLAGWRHLPRLLASLWRLAPSLTLWVGLLRLLRALQPPAMLFVAKLIVDEILLQGRSAAPGQSLTEWLESGRMTALLGFIALEFALVAGGNVLNRVGTLLESLLFERHGHGLSIALVEHAAGLDLRDVESSTAQNRLQRANVATGLGQQVLTLVFTQIQNAVTLAVLVGGVLLFLPGLILLLAAALIPTLLAELHFNNRQYVLSTSLIPERRRLQDLQRLGTSASSAKEVRLFELGPYLAGRMGEVAARIMAANRALATRRALWSSLAGAAGSLAYYAVYAVVAWRALSGAISIGDLTFLAGSLMRLNALVEGLVVGLTQLTGQTQYVGDLYSFMDMSSALAPAAEPKPFPTPIRRGIVFDNVGFRYPGTQGWALRHLAFRIEAGETLALVGENGAGKTTIVKLLTRLYEPDEGRILIDGVDLREIEPTQLRSHIGVIFQDFVRYNATAAENIGIGRVARLADRPAIVAAAVDSRADSIIASLPAAYDQMLGLSFMDGLDLSGGQWQKLAISRGYFRDADILILDEPTAALDARAEAEVFERFRDLSAGRTALLISHRFSTVRMADRILVLENGSILESGSHAELVSSGGRYAELFDLQAAGFR